MVLQLNQINKVQKEDTLSNLIGHFGRWQFILFSSVFIVKLSSGWVQMAILFMTPQTTFWCTDFGNSTLDYDDGTNNFDANSTFFEENSTCYDNCLKYEYDSHLFNNTIISEWDLVCERRWLASFTQMILQLGILIGSILFGFLSDRYGRKITFLASITTLIAFGFGIPFSPNYTVFTCLRFLLGVSTAGTMVVSFVIVMEAIGPKYRSVSGCIFQLPFTLGHMTLPVFAYFFRNWDTYSLAMAIPQLIYLGNFFLLNESPRWLVSVGKVEEATEIVTRAAEMNNLSTTKIKESLTQFSQDILSRSDEPKSNYSDLFCSSLRLKTICCCIMWLICGLTFFGFNQYISQTSSDPFISVAAAGSIQIPSILILMWLLTIFGRKIITATFFCFGGLSIILLGCITNTFWSSLLLGTLGVSCMSIVATTIYIYTSELFPTVVRNMAIGACSTSMRIGSMIAPFVSNSAATVPWLPTVIFGVAPVCAGVICLLLPETKDTTLPDSIDKVKNKDDVN